MFHYGILSILLILLGYLAHALQPEREPHQKLMPHHSRVLRVAHTTYLPRYLLPAPIPNDKTWLKPTTRAKRHHNILMEGSGFTHKILGFSTYSLSAWNIHCFYPTNVLYNRELPGRTPSCKGVVAWSQQLNRRLELGKKEKKERKKKKKTGGCPSSPPPLFTFLLGVSKVDACWFPCVVKLEISWYNVTLLLGEDVEIPPLLLTPPPPLFRPDFEPGLSLF